MGFRPAEAQGAVPHSPRNAVPLSGDRPRAHAAFESGNLGSSEWLSPSHLRFTARADLSPRPLWFYFCLEDLRVPTVLCELVNADDCFGPRHAWTYARPVYSDDGRTWHRVDRADYRPAGEAPGTFRFSVPVSGPVTYVAYCFPYTTAHLSSLLAAAGEGVGCAIRSCGESVEGRPVPCLTFGVPALGAPAVWVLARQHAGESPASWVVDGLIRQLLASRWEDLGGSIQVVPMVDPDGVFAGRYGKDESPVDFNRDWSRYPARRETAAILSAMRVAHSAHPTLLVLDIHASHHGDTECYLFGEPPRRVTARDRQALVVERMAHHGPPAIGLRSTDLRHVPAPLDSARGYLAREFDCPALTLEVSYHLTQSGRYPTPQDYRDLGSATAHALRDLLAACS